MNNIRKAALAAYLETHYCEPTEEQFEAFLEAQKQQGKYWSA